MIMSPSQPNHQNDLNQATRRLILNVYLLTALISFLTMMGSFYLFGEPITRIEVAATVLFSLLLSWSCVDQDLEKGTLHLSDDQKSWLDVDCVLGDVQ